MRQKYLLYFCLILCLTGVPGEEESIYRAVQKFLVNEGLDAGPLDETAYMTLITKALKTYLQLQGYSLEVNENWDEELIKALQEFLNGIDNTGLWVDGDFGSKTKRSLRYFVGKSVCNMGGFVFRGPYLIPGLGNVASWKECSGLCRKESICSDWSWANNTCYLVSKERSDQKIPVKLAVSGDRRCGLFTESACPNLVAGDAAGGTEKQWQGKHTKENCIKKCLENPLSVGVTTQSANLNVLSVGTDDVLCWCEFGYKWLRIDDSKDYETCSFPNEDSPIKVKISPVNLSPNNFTCRARGGRDLSTMEFTVLNLDEEKYQKMGPNYIFITDQEFEKSLNISCRIFDKKGIIIAEDWKIINSTANPHNEDYSAVSTSSLIIIIILLVMVAASGLILYKFKSHHKSPSTEAIVMVTADLPPHGVLIKDDNLQKNLLNLVNDTATLKVEFKALAQYTDTYIREATSVGMQLHAHNRYRDILPYNNNTITLERATGEPPVTYVNASPISFPQLRQQFIAAQAPKPNSFSNFWQMILEKKVGVIVMITDLVEKGRRKADQYWPDIEGPVMEFANIKVSYESHSFSGTLYHRKLMVLDTSTGLEVGVHHLQTTNWSDMTAPDDSKVLMDILYKTQELTTDAVPNDPMLVHCSAGVGRTGSFIAVYALAALYHDDRVDSLDVMDTVVAMRRQRMLMVQQMKQYVYVHKCLQHYISAQEADYDNT